MQDYLLFVDTETSGVPDSLNAPISDLKNWPFVLQLAWIVYDRDGNEIKQENHFIYEEDIYIKDSSIKIHGITKDSLKTKGKDRKIVMKLFANDLRRFKPVIVGHFIEFDSKMLQVAFFRSGLKNILSKHRHFCTMRATTEYTRFQNHQYPKLNELYETLFSEKLENNHDALVDAQATARCFLELWRKAEITADSIQKQRLFVKVSEKEKKIGCGLPVLLFILIGLISIWL